MNYGINDMYLTQEELAERWKLSTATLERDRSRTCEVGMAEEE